MLEDIKHVKDKVKVLLTKWPELRDSDKELWLAYANQYHNIKQKIQFVDDPYDALKKLILDEMPAFESITRARRELTNNGNLKASEDVEQERRGEELKMTGHYMTDRKE